ncbi:hypothetical protein OQA88_10701 [Cercophora sp. LCS_1]
MCNAVAEQWGCGHIRFKEWDVENCPKAQGCLEDRCKELGPRQYVPGKGRCPSDCDGPGRREKKMTALPLPVAQHPPLPGGFWDAQRSGIARATIYVGMDEEGLLTARPDKNPNPWARDVEEKSFKGSKQ